MSTRIALLGDDRGHPSHQELNALIPRLDRELAVGAEWAPTAEPIDPRDFDGIWLVPGSPYDNDSAVYDALTVTREAGIPFLGTCGGLQYAVIEFLRNVLGQAATHAESDGEGEDNAVSVLACSLYGQERTVIPVGPSRFAQWSPDPFTGMHYCNYAPNRRAVQALQAAGAVIGARNEDGDVEVIEFPGHAFSVASLFQPHIGASTGAPIHPLIQAFVAAAALQHASGGTVRLQQ